MPAFLERCHRFLVASKSWMSIRAVLSAAKTGFKRSNGTWFTRMICEPGALPETSLELFGAFVEGGVFLNSDPLSHFGQRGQPEKLVSDLQRSAATGQ